MKGKSLKYGKANAIKHYTYFSNEGSFKAYLRFVQSYKEIPPKEQNNYIIKYKETGNPFYRDIIIYSNQRAIISIVKTFDPDPEDIMDYIQEANLGLLDCIERYNTKTGVLFMTYATYYVRYYINKLQHSTENIHIRINKSIVKYIHNLCDFINDCLDKKIPLNHNYILLHTGCSYRIYHTMLDYINYIFNVYSYDDKIRCNRDVMIKYYIEYTKHELMYRKYQEIDYSYNEITSDIENAEYVKNIITILWVYYHLNIYNDFVNRMLGLYRGNIKSYMRPKNTLVFNDDILHNVNISHKFIINTILAIIKFIQGYIEIKEHSNNVLPVFSSYKLYLEGEKHNEEHVEYIEKNIIKPNTSIVRKLVNSVM